MSSSTLPTIQVQLNRYAYAIFMIFGNIGNAFVAIIFSQQRQNACSIYLLTSAILNMVYQTVYGFLAIFPFNYNDETPLAFAVCRISPYISTVLGQIAKTMIVLACIDRFLITSDRATFRAFSTPKRAKYLIFFTIIFWSVVSIHIPIMETIVHGQCGAFGIYLTIYSIYAIITVGLIPPVISVVFGYLTYSNMRQIHVRVQSVMQNTNDANNSIRRRDRDLLILVTSEVSVYMVTTALLPVILIEILISGYTLPNKSLEYAQTEAFVRSFAVLLLFINSAAPFYTYVIVSKPFCRDFKQLITNSYRKLTRQTDVQIILRRDQALTQQETRV
jgi:hypothetical protein